jgi:2-polyprenyl-3-methyl-5-hydroxy-6-metoxy-1,4-benzoquinol methylase
MIRKLESDDPMDHDPCPVCGSTRWYALFLAPDPMFDVMGRYEVLRCLVCRTLAVGPDQRPEARRASYYHGDYYSYEAYEGGHALRLKASAYRVAFGEISGLGPIRLALMPLSQLMRSLPLTPEKSLLDVGCGAGKFLALASRVGLRTFGVEPDRLACESAAHHSVGIHHGRFEDFQLPGHPWPTEFDYVTASHVLEHADDPRLFLQRLRDVLAPSGTAFVSMPNPASWAARLFGRFWSQIDAPRHLYLFPPSAMRRLCASEGLRVNRVRYLGNEYGFAMSFIVMIESRFRVSRHKRLVSSLLVMSRILLFPFYTMSNLVGRGDTIEYELSVARASGD